MESPDNRSKMFVVFRLGKEQFYIDINVMDEVINIREIVDIPDAPHYVRGVTRHRTTVIPVVGINKKLGIPEGEISKKSKILVVRYGSESIGIIIDELLGIMDEPVEAANGTKGIHSYAKLLNLNQVLCSRN